MKLILLFGLFLFANSLKLYADKTYPFQLSKLDYYEGGRLIVDNSKPIYSYLIKYNIGIQALEIYSWQGLDRKNEKGNSIFASSIIANFADNGKLYLLINENSKVSIVEYDNNLVQIRKVFIEKVNFQLNPSGKIIILNKNILFFLLNSKLYSMNISKNNESLKEIDSNIDNAIFFKDKLAAISKNDINTIVRFYDYKGNFLFSNRLELFENVKLIKDNEFLYILTSINLHSQTMIHFIDIKSGNILFNDWVDSKINHIAINNRKIIRLVQNNGTYSIAVSFLNNLTNKNIQYLNDLPNDLIEPLLIESIGSSNYIIFKNGIVSFSEKGEIVSNDNFPIGEYYQEVPELKFIENRLILVSDYNTITFLKTDIDYWYFNRFINKFSGILIPTFFLLILIIFIQLYRHQKRILNEIISLPSIGVILVVDKSGRLIRINPQGREFLGINANLPKRKFLAYYCNYEHSKPVEELIDKSLAARESFTQRININLNGNHKEWLCNTIILSNIAGRFRGLVFTGIDITEQLERNRLSNWAQLAHDMQTNLSTIRLNAEQIDTISDNNISRQKKIFHQVNLLIQRVRDIVTVGRTDKLDKMLVSSSEICLEVRNEFDDLMFPNIRFETELCDFLVECDKPKLIRALRNATENAIKIFKGSFGLVTIKCYEEDRFAYFVIKDNGIGMDEPTKHKMLTPYFTTAKSDGGSGIGTMIMQHVTELHGGKIIINSELNIGTEVIFQIPNFTHKRKIKKFVKVLS